VVGSQLNEFSFRIGAAAFTTAVEVPVTTIKLLVQRINAYQCHIQPSPEDLACVSQQLV